jgi:hypothetical protein
MNRKTLTTVAACILAIAIICRLDVSAAVYEGSAPEKQNRLAQKVKAAILELGSGPSTRVTVKLKDKTTLAGYVSEITDDSFAVTDLAGAATTSVAYPDVAQVKGNNLSTGAKIAIAAAIIAGIAITLYIVRGAFCDGC